MGNQWDANWDADENVQSIMNHLSDRSQSGNTADCDEDDLGNYPEGFYPQVDVACLAAAGSFGPIPFGPSQPQKNSSSSNRDQKRRQRPRIVMDAFDQYTGKGGGGSSSSSSGGSDDDDDDDEEAASEWSGWAAAGSPGATPRRPTPRVVVPPEEPGPRADPSDFEEVD